MALNLNRPPSSLKKDGSEGRILANQIYVGIVKDNSDAHRMGRLRVWIPEFGGAPGDPASWVTVSYASPFAGATSPAGLVEPGQGGAAGASNGVTPTMSPTPPASATSAPTAAGVKSAASSKPATPTVATGSSVVKRVGSQARGIDDIARGTTPSTHNSRADGSGGTFPASTTSTSSSSSTTTPATATSATTATPATSSTSATVSSMVTPGAITVTDPGKKMEGTQRSYGMWMIPPDLENQVLVCFAGGDTARGYYFACLYQQNMNHMVPGIPLNASTDQTLNQTVLPPVCEYNKKDTEIDISDPSKTQRPVFEPLHYGLLEQGLYMDPERGASTTGARRQQDGTLAPVFGILTPGGNTINVDEDPTNEFIRLRTKSGVQILLHESTGYIYMNSKYGNSWMEISDEGINMYSKFDINMRAEGSINFHADNNVATQGGSVHTRGGNVTTYAAGQNTIETGGNQVRQAGNILDNPANADGSPQYNTTGKDDSAADTGSGETVTGNAPSSEGFVMPTEGVVSSGYGVPRAGHPNGHEGIDIAAPQGTPVVATKGGVVRIAQRVGDYGNAIYIDHPDGTQTRYGHLANGSTLVHAGQTVNIGQQIGAVGSTGHSTGPHLHYEIRVGSGASNATSHAINPSSMYDNQTLSKGTMITRGVDSHFGTPSLKKSKLVGDDIDLIISKSTKVSSPEPGDLVILQDKSIYEFMSKQGRMFEVKDTNDNIRQISGSSISAIRRMPFDISAWLEIIKIKAGCCGDHDHDHDHEITRGTSDTTTASTTPHNSRADGSGGSFTTSTHNSRADGSGGTYKDIKTVQSSETHNSRADGTGGSFTTENAKADAAAKLAAKTPPKPSYQMDVTGSAGAYTFSTTSTIAGNLPSHEPWIGHPTPQKIPRAGLGAGGTAAGGGSYGAYPTSSGGALSGSAFDPNATNSGGIDPNYFKTMAKIESNNNPNAVSSTGCAGLFQFSRSTGAAYGLVGPGYDNRTNPEASYNAVVRFTQDNAAGLQRRNIPVTPETLYMAHQQGVGGTSQIWSAANGGGTLSPKTLNNMNLNMTPQMRRNVLNGTNSIQEAVAVYGDQAVAKMFLDQWLAKFRSVYASQSGQAPETGENGSIVQSQAQSTAPQGSAASKPPVSTKPTA